jgi:hypothetical protein
LTTSPSGAVRVANPHARCGLSQPQRTAHAPLSSFAGLVEEKIIPAEDANLLPF